MRQAQHVGEAHVPCPGAIHGAGHGREFAVGGGGEDDSARTLAQIDRLAVLLERAGLCGEKVHQVSPFELMGIAVATSARAPQTAMAA